MHFQHMRDLVSKEMDGIRKDDTWSSLLASTHTNMHVYVCMCAHACMHTHIYTQYILKKECWKAGRKADGHLVGFKTHVWALILNCCIWAPVNIPPFLMKKLAQQMNTQYSQGLTASKLMILSVHPCSSRIFQWHPAWALHFFLTVVLMGTSLSTGYEERS